MSTPHTKVHHPAQPVRGLLPAFAGWESVPGAIGNIAAFVLAVIGGEWIVHQVEYLIEYGSQFGAVMAASPHRLYMPVLGMLLVILGLVAAFGMTLLLYSGNARLRRLLVLLPARLRPVVPRDGVRVPLFPLLWTALLLAFLQAALYLTQENIESANFLGSLPGLTVLFAPEHATVLPLHLLVASLGSVLLWSAASWLHTVRRAVEVAQALVRLVLGRIAAPVLRVPRDASGPIWPIAVTRRDPRAPPMFPL